jgi:hypothetical protein
MHCHVMNVATPSVMAAKDGSDHQSIICCNKAHPGIAGEVRLNTLPRIGLAESDAVALLPQGKHAVVN